MTRFDDVELWIAIAIIIAVFAMVVEAFMTNRKTDATRDVMLECVQHNTYQECNDENADVDQPAVDDDGMRVGWDDDLSDPAAAPAATDDNPYMD